MTGLQLNKRCHLNSELGRGGTGVVFRAHDTLLQRDVAVKVISTTLLHEEGHARILREAQPAAPIRVDELLATIRVEAVAASQGAAALDPLTEREMEVLRLVAKGLSNKR